MSATLDLPASELAHWLIDYAADRLWSVEGEDSIEQAISLPCAGSELAEEFVRRGGVVRLHGPTTGPMRRRADLGRLSELADGREDDGEIMLRLTWLRDGREGPEWFVVTDQLAEEATRAAHAS